MSQQPEALELISLFELEADPESLYRRAAAELHRLHAVEFEALELLAKLSQEKEVVAALLAEQARLQCALNKCHAQVERLTRELYQATNPPFIGKTDSWQAACGKARTERDEARTQVESLQAEVNEQARLNGMGAERELALMAKVEILQAASVEWSPAYTRGPARQSAPVAAVPALVQLTEEQMISAVRQLCNTDQVAERLVAVSIDEYRAIEAAIAKINGLTVGDGAQPIKDAP